MSLLLRHALLLAVAIFGNQIAFGQSVTPLPQAHAHNDYLHQRPLLDALDQGFSSVEADIFLVGEQLLVAHTQAEISPTRTLQALYLDPLRARIKNHKGSVYETPQLFTLLIDIKSGAEETYRALDAVLAGYHDMLTSVERGADGAVRLKPGAVTVIISGNRPIDVVAADLSRYVGIDGRLSDLHSEQAADLLPLISDNWGQHFQWRGVGPIPPADQEKLAAIIEQAHGKQRRVRFWATPDNATAWGVLREAGVDLINTDDLAGLAQFLRSAP